MQDDVSEDDRLFEEAMNLIIRFQNDRGNPIVLDMIRAWRSRSAQHEHLWQEVVEIHGMSGQILADHRNATGQHEHTSMTRRNLMIAGGLCLGAAASSGLVLPDALRRWRADYTTMTSEVRRIALPDGSFATLGPDSALSLRFGSRQRGLDMEGMCFFEVSPDPQRPFRVTTKGVEATALGTAYDVAEESGFVSVSVDHGTVAVNSEGSKIGQLEGGQWLRFDLNEKTFARGDRDATEVAAWRNGLIFADRDRVATIVERIARWHQGKVIIADNSLASKEISGVFDVNQPTRALEAVVQPYGGKVRQLSPWLTIISSI